MLEYGQQSFYYLTEVYRSYKSLADGELDVISDYEIMQLRGTISIAKMPFYSFCEEVLPKE